MQVTVKNLQQQTFKVEVGEEDTVLDFKKKIEVLIGSEYDVSYQKLIYGGKILEDSAKVSLYEITEKGFVVVMTAKPKPAPVVDNGNIQTQNNEMRNVEDTESAFPDEEDNENDAFAALVSEPRFQQCIQLVRSNPHVFPTLIQQISQTNPEIYEILVQNKDRLLQLIQGQHVPSGTPSQQRRQEQNGSSNNNPLAALTSNPQFQQLRQDITSNPGAAMDALRHFGQNNPEMFNLIRQNPEQFQQLLSSQSGGQSNQIRVTMPEKEAIDRLKALGFPEMLCVQAYFACDKNEELAANFLLQQQYDDLN